MNNPLPLAFVGWSKWHLQRKICTSYKNEKTPSITNIFLWISSKAVKSFTKANLLLCTNITWKYMDFLYIQLLFHQKFSLLFTYIRTHLVGNSDITKVKVENTNKVLFYQHTQFHNNLKQRTKHTVHNLLQKIRFHFHT